MLDLAIQIVNYNTKKYLIECLDCILKDLKDSNIFYKIFVLDNASQDDLSDLEEKYREAEVSFCYSDKNLGFGAGHNFLAKQAESKYILILNADLKFVEKQIIQRLYSYFEKEKNNRVVVVGPKLINEKGVQKWDHGELYGFWAWLAEKTGNSYWKNTDKISQVAWVSGAVFLISRKAFNEIGRFDENFFLYGEEVDLCLRLRQRGYKIIYNPLIKIFHYGSVVASKDKFIIASEKYFIKKHFSQKGKIQYAIVLFLGKIKHKFLYKFIFPK